MSKIYAVHFLQADMQPHLGRQGKPWRVGETRSVTGELKLCKNGFHYCPTWEAAIKGAYLYGPVATIVEVDDDGPHDNLKGCSRARTLIGAWNVESEMRLFAADEATRALKAWEKRTGKKADARSWDAIKAARQIADGKITPAQLAAAWAAASAAARDAARAAAEVAASAASRDANAKRFARAMKDATGWEALP